VVFFFKKPSLEIVDELSYLFLGLSQNSGAAKMPYILFFRGRRIKCLKGKRKLCLEESSGTEMIFTFTQL
jgi:hypothetical protein